MITLKIIMVNKKVFKSRKPQIVEQGNTTQKNKNRKYLSYFFLNAMNHK